MGNTLAAPPPPKKKTTVNYISGFRERFEATTYTEAIEWLNIK